MRISKTVLSMMAAAAAALSPGQFFGINAFDLGRADAVIIGTVSAAPPKVVELPCKSGDGYDPGDLPAQPFAIYTLTDVVSLKGRVGPTVRVIGDTQRPLGGASAHSLPIGRRVLVVLQAPRDGWFAHDRNRQMQSTSYFGGCDKADFAIFITESGDFTEVGSPEGGFHPKRDFVGYDVARVLALPLNGPKFPLTERLRLDTEIAALARCQQEPQSAAEYSCTKGVFGPDPAGFMTSEILPSLPSPATDCDRLRLLVLAGTWGDEQAADHIADLILRLGKCQDDVSRKAAAGAAMAATGFTNGLAAAARLLTSEEPAVLAAVAPHVASPSLRTSHGPLLLALLDRTEPEVLRAAMAALASVYRDLSHQPELRANSNGFEPGSTNAERLQYWKSRRAELLAGK